MSIVTKVLPLGDYTVQHTDAGGVTHNIFLNRNGLIVAGTRAGKTLLAAKIARIASDRGMTIINFAKNLQSQASDWELKHERYNRNNEWMWEDANGMLHIFITDLATKSQYFLLALETAKKMPRVFHILKNDNNIAKLASLFEEANLDSRMGNRILFLADEVHHALHITNRKKEVKSNILLLELFEKYKKYASVLGFTATPNCVREHPLWEEFYYLRSKYSFDLEEEVRFFPIASEKHTSFRNKDEVKIPSESQHFISREVPREGVLLIGGIFFRDWQAHMTRYCINQYKDSVVVLEVNSSKYKVHTYSEGESTLNKEPNGRKINSMISAIDVVYKGHPNKKIIVITQRMGEEGESYHDKEAETCLTGLLWCPPLEGVDDTQAQFVGRIDITLAKEHGWDVEVCGFSSYWEDVCIYIRDTAEKNERKSAGLEYNDDVLELDSFKSTVVNKEAYILKPCFPTEEWNKVIPFIIPGVGKILREKDYRGMAAIRKNTIKPYLIELFPDLEYEIESEAVVTEYDLSQKYYERYHNTTTRSSRNKNRRLVIRKLDEDTIAVSLLLVPLNTSWNPKKYRVYNEYGEVIPSCYKSAF